MEAKPIILLVLLFVLTVQEGVTQSVLINNDGGTPEPSAILEVRSDSLGVLIPRMVTSKRTSIPTPAKGLLVYQTNGTQGFYYYNGTAWDTLEANSVINPVTSTNSSRISIIQDRKAAGSDGGTFLSGNWDTRDLTYLAGDSSFIEIDGDSIFSLDSGLYELNITAPARQVDEHQIRLFNLDSNTVVANGTAARARQVSTTSELYTVIKLEVKTNFIVQHRCTIDNFSSDAKGLGISWGDCIFTQIKIQQLN